ncbi:MAG: hypothetical protein ACRDSZ_05655 [Pseudonocardiaceae bacterium]
MRNASPDMAVGPQEVASCWVERELAAHLHQLVVGERQQFELAEQCPYLCLIGYLLGDQQG